MPTPTPSLPSPHTWTTGSIIPVPYLRADVSNAVAFLGQKPLFVGQAANGGSIPNNTDTAMQMQAELTDAWATHVAQNLNGATTSQVWAPVPGWYLCRNTVPYAAGSGAFPIAAGFQGTVSGSAYGPIHGAPVISGASTPYAAQATDLIQQVNVGAPGGSGDYIQPIAWQASGGALSLSSAAFTLPTASVRWACALSGTQPLPVPPLTTVPSPITSAWMNANVRDAVNFLTYPPACKAYYVAGSASMPSNTLGTPATVPCNTVGVDTYGGWNTSTFTYTVPVSGIYILAGQFILTTSATATTYAAGLSVNGTVQWGDILTYAPSSGTSGGATVSRRLRLTAGQTVQLVGSQGSGGSLAYATSTISQSRFIAVWDGI